jgi:ornithine cyclodeaminase/alanine dehydrogenase-like protein (mu-crystallin family)
MRNNIQFITDEKVKELLPMNEAIELMKKAFIQISTGNVTLPQRIQIDMPQVSADSLIMPVYSAADKKYAVKIVSLNQDNPSQNLPFIHAIMILFNAENGQPVAILDAESLTAIRTGAASGLATKLLSKLNASIAAIFGAGVQAKYQLKGICAIREIKEVFLFEKNIDKAKSFKEELERESSITIHISSDQSILKEAEIICTATTSKVPVVKDELISPGTHINSIGSYQPTKREIPSETVRRSTVFVDSKEACLKEAGDLIIPANEGNRIILSEIGEVLRNKKSGRTSGEEITLFKSVGTAAQDLTCAIHIFEKFSNSQT